MQEAGLIETKKERTPLLEIFDRPKKILALKEESDLHELMKNRIHGITMSQDKQNELWDYAKTFPKQFDSAIKGAYNSKENEVLVAAYVYLNGNSDAKRYVMDHFCKDAKDILRFVSLISERNGANNGRKGEHAEKLTSTNSFDVRLSREDKRFVKELMNQCRNLYHDMWNRDQVDYWKKLMRNIDAKEGPDRVVQAFNNLATKNKVLEDGTPVLSIDKLFNEAKRDLRDGHWGVMEAFMQAYPAYSLQRAYNIMSITPNECTKDIVVSMIDAFSKCDPVAILKTYNYLTIRDKNYGHGDAGSDRIVRNAKGDLMVESRKEITNLNVAKFKALQSVLECALDEQIEGTKDLGCVYINPKLYDIKSPSRDDVYQSAGSVYTKGSRIDGNKDKNLVCMGISWKNGISDRVDIDLHAFVTYNNGSKDEVSFTGLRLRGSNDEQIIVHSGDYTTGDPFNDGKGAQEFIIFDKNLLRENGIKEVTMYIHNYNGSSFDESQEVCSMYMEKEGDMRTDIPKRASESYNEYGYCSRPVFCGELIELSQFEQQLKIVSKSADVVTLSYDVAQDQFLLIDEANGGVKEQHRNNKGYYSSDRSRNVAEKIVSYCKLSPNPSLGQVFEAYALGNVTNDITKADTVFTVTNPETEGLKPEARIITAADREIIANEFLVRQEKVSIDPDIFRQAADSLNFQFEDTLTQDTDEGFDPADE